MNSYEINNGRYTKEWVGMAVEGLYQSEERIDCTKFMPDADGNPIPIPAPEPVVPEPYIPTAEEIKQSLINAVQSHLDASAMARGYDGIVSVTSYSGDIALADGDPVIEKFITEGNAYYLWRSKVWAYCYAQLDKVLAGERTCPTAEELIAELPALGL